MIAQIAGPSILCFRQYLISTLTLQVTPSIVQYPLRSILWAYDGMDALPELSPHSRRACGHYICPQNTRA